MALPNRPGCARVAVSVSALVGGTWVCRKSEAVRGLPAYSHMSATRAALNSSPAPRYLPTALR